ncbi:MAG TPA: DNA polymerase ligase N-terminal domain-containing protein [Planctomycetaceae bacterium]|jgi:hypothetical protein
MPRFVVLTHDHRFLHWDFMLEKEAGLRTWRLPHAPGGMGVMTAEPLAEHRLVYLDYEGPVSGDRGTVHAFDRGEYIVVEESGDSFVVQLSGAKLMGQASIRRQSATGGWTFEFRPGRDS